MRLITVEILDYYDYPLLFIAENDKKHKFLCMLIDETDFLGYLVVKSTTSAIEKMKNNEKDIRSIFEHPEDNHYYYAKMNSKTNQWFSIKCWSKKEDVSQYFPERGVFLSEERDECLSDISTQLTLSSLERHKEELLIKLEENYSHLIFLTNINQDDTICTSIGTVPSENFIGVDFNDYSVSYHGDNKCKITKTKVA